MDLFGDLGDIADLGDIPDFTKEQEAKKMNILLTMASIACISNLVLLNEFQVESRIINADFLAISLCVLI